MRKIRQPAESGGLHASIINSACCPVSWSLISFFSSSSSAYLSPPACHSVLLHLESDLNASVLHRAVCVCVCAATLSSSFFRHDDITTTVCSQDEHVRLSACRLLVQVILFQQVFVMRTGRMLLTQPQFVLLVQT